MASIPRKAWRECSPSKPAPSIGARNKRANHYIRVALLVILWSAIIITTIIVPIPTDDSRPIRSLLHGACHDLLQKPPTE